MAAGPVIRDEIGQFTCPSPEWQKSALGEMKAITPPIPLDYIQLSDCDDHGVVSYESDPGDADANVQSITRLAEARGWQRSGEAVSTRCLTKDLADGTAYLLVTTGYDGDSPVARAFIRADDSYCAPVDPARLVCPSAAWERSAVAELEAVAPPNRRSSISRSTCELRRLVVLEGDEGDDAATADSVVRTAEARGWRVAEQPGDSRCLSKDLTYGQAYLLVLNPYTPSLATPLAYIAPDRDFCEMLA